MHVAHSEFANSVVLFNGVELNYGTMCKQLMAEAACRRLRVDHIKVSTTEFLPLLYSDCRMLICTRTHVGHLFDIILEDSIRICSSIKRSILEHMDCG